MKSTARSLRRTCELLRFVCWYCSQVPQIALVTDQHYDNVRVRVITEFFQPPGHIVIRLVLANVVDE